MANLTKIAGGKRLLIDKANATMLIIIGSTAFLVVFSLVASKALLSQSSYQSRVLKERQKTLKQLKDNNKNVTTLVTSYKSFAGEAQNVLGGNPAGAGVIDGDNPKIILDSLPSKYDFPGLISSVEKLLSSGGFKIESIGGSDDELAQQNSSTDKPTPIAIPFPVSVSVGNEQGAQNFLTVLERSIRPMYVDSLNVTASQSKLLVSVSAHTFYQPEKTLKITTKVIK